MINSVTNGIKGMSPGRIKKLQGKIAGAGMEAAIVLYSRDVFYYTGTAQPSVLLITPKEFHLFIRRGYDFAITDGRIRLNKDNLSNESRLEMVSNKLKEWKVTKGVVGLELDIMPAETYLKWLELLPNFQIVNVSPLILEQRMKKDVDEIALIRKACHVMDAGHMRALEVLEEGTTELELSAAIEHAHRRAGDEGATIIRHPDFCAGTAMVSSGTNLCKVSGIVNSLGGVGLSAAVPIGASLKKIMRGEPIVIDKAVLHDGYYADQSRTYVIGKASSDIRSLFYSLKDVSDYVIANLTDGVKCDEIYRLAWQRSQELGLKDYFQDLGSGKIANFIAHGVGLEANELPLVMRDNHSTIHNGYVLSVEMHIMHPGYGAVKLEDMVLITNHGAEILSVSPRELFEVER